jgi:hypothetical protein
MNGYTLHAKLAGMLTCTNSMQVATDLLEFYNTAEESVTVEDLELLARLQNSGRFKSWECPTCGDRMYQADPEDWGDFQECYNPDYISFPEGHKKQCDDCRMREPLIEKEARRLGLDPREMLEPVSAEESMRRLMATFGI